MWSMKVVKFHLYMHMRELFRYLDACGGKLPLYMWWDDGF